MSRARYASEQNSEVSLLPVIILLVVFICLYAFDVRVLDFVASAIRPAVPPGLSP